jgi:hypothetical protein
LSLICLNQEGLLRFFRLRRVERAIPGRRILRKGLNLLEKHV